MRRDKFIIGIVFFIYLGLQNFLFSEVDYSHRRVRNPSQDILLSPERILSLEEAEEEIRSRWAEGGWVGVVDIDQLNLINRIYYQLYSKAIVDVILGDIKRIFAKHVQEKGGFIFTYRKGDEIGIYLPSLSKEEVELLFEEISEEISLLNYQVFILPQMLTPEELNMVKDILDVYKAHIPVVAYDGFQLGIIKCQEGQDREVLEEMFSLLKNRLGHRVNYEIFLEGKLQSAIVPTFSAGIVSLARIPPGEGALEEAFYRAQDTEFQAKQKGRDEVIVGYAPEYRHEYSGKGLLPQELRAPARKVMATLWDEKRFRSEVYAQVQEGQGLLLIINPRYCGQEGLHYINAVYTYQGGDDVISFLSYLLVRGFREVYPQVLLGRRIDRILVFLPHVSNLEDVLSEVLRIVETAQVRFQEEMGIQVRFDIGASEVDEEARTVPGFLFQKADFALLEVTPQGSDSSKNRIFLYDSQKRTDIQDAIAALGEESLEDLVVNILQERILPRARSLEEVRELAVEDRILRKVDWDYILTLLEARDLWP